MDSECKRHLIMLVTENKSMPKLAMSDLEKAF